MAMKIANNSSALSTLNQLNQNNSQLNKALSKVSTGQKINSAADDASSFGISEQLRVLIRALDQDYQNVQNGSTMLKTAHGGIQEIIDELRSLKELAINAANDSNTDSDRAILQRDLEQKRDNIDDIATMTNYNTKPLLDGGQIWLSLSHQVHQIVSKLVLQKLAMVMGLCLIYLSWVQAIDGLILH